MSEDIKKDASAAPESEKKEKKKSKKDAQIEALQTELEAKNDQFMRTVAEFANFKDRTEREKASIAEITKAGLIKQLLPILDNIDRVASYEAGSAEYIKGIEMIVKQFEAITANLNIEEIAKEGDVFDPNFHEAVMHVEDENFGENVVVQVLQKGYKIGNTVIRAAMVKVAN